MKTLSPMVALLILFTITLTSFGCSNSVPTTTAVEDNSLSEHFDDLTVHRKTVEDIPVVEVFIDNGVKKPVILAAHSYMTSKEQQYSIANQLAKEGFYVVMFDAYGHGERSGKESKSFPQVMAMYPYDMEKVLSTLKNNPQADVNKLGMTGISMGACAIYKYCTIADIKPKAIAPIVGTPFYEQFVNTELSVTTFDTKFGSGVTSLSQSEVNNILADSSPYKDRDKLNGISMLLQQGKSDHVVPPVGAEMLYQDLTSKGAQNIELIVHEGLGHNVEQFQFDLVVDFFKKHLK